MNASDMSNNHNYCMPILQGTAQRYALPALGRGRRSRPTGKMLRRRKLLEIAARPPGSPRRQGHAGLGSISLIRLTVDYLNLP